jgi:hypothetical protein
VRACGRREQPLFLALASSRSTGFVFLPEHGKPASRHVPPQAVLEHDDREHPLAPVVPTENSVLVGTVDLGATAG